MTTKQNRIVYSLSAHQRRIDARLTSAFLALVAALKAVPAGAASWWYNAARADAPVHPKGRDAVVAAQLAMQAALETHDPAVIEETAEAIANYFDEMKAAALIAYFERAGGSVEGLLVDTSRETSEAMHELTRVALQPRCPSAVERAVRELREALNTGTRLLPMLERLLLVSSFVGSGKRATGVQS